jgi:lysine N6-hydroxylase
MPSGDESNDFFDLAGVGVGPSNLSLAALADPVQDLRAVFFEARPAFAWHPGLLDGNAQIQTSYLKDLVTPVDPTSRYSFLSFLKDTGRLYRFIVANPQHVTRVEFEQYYRWVTQRLPSVRFGADVEFIEFVDGLFTLHAAGTTTRARSIVLATGLTPHVPLCARPLLGEDVLHASSYDLAAPDVAGRRVLLVGGGQTGAELFLRLLLAGRFGPREITWLSSRPNFLPLDDTPFTNELFFPNYVEHFRTLPPDERRQALQQQRLASDGIDAGTLTQIYRRLYVLDFLADPWLRYRLLPDHRMTGLTSRPGGLEAAVERPAGNRARLQADVVVLCTGFAYAQPACLAPIEHRIHRTDDGYRVGADFSIAWDGPRDRRIYVQNAARHSHGIADPNLSLTAWRSAVIVNSVCGRAVYEVSGSSAAISWPRDEVSPAENDTEEMRSEL